ncbi:3-phenylpropionate MFS transporter [Photobacterium sp. 53610]|uniref:3-phenylpropionate MFS transporter n=1 Tax=Photobacterium sp. 53610 TaxID=3102789 RepID=UPI002EDB8767
MLRSSPFGWTAQYMFGFYFNYGVYLPFWAVWLDALGIPAGDIGLLLGLGLGVRCFANMVLTPRIHRVEHLLPALRWLALLSLICCAAFVMVSGNLLALTVVIVLFNLLVGPVIPLSDSLANYYAKEGHLDYGRTRLWGSIAFIVGSTIAGLAAAELGSQVIPWVAMLGLGAALLLSLRQPTVLPAEAEAQRMARPPLTGFLRDRRVIRFLLIVALLQGSHAAYYSFSAMYWKSIGFSEAISGYLWSFSVVAEITVFALSKRLFAGWSVAAMFRLAAAGVLLRWGLTATMTELPMLVLTQALHGVTFAAAHLAAIRYIQHAESHQMVALQALYNALPLGAVMAALTTLSGWGYGWWGADVFWLMALMGLPVLLMKIDETPAEHAAPVREAV